MAKNPLAEVFGFRHNAMSSDAKRHRKMRLCPFHNKIPNCTKDKANNPLGVCSIYDNGAPVIICPIRFRENWTIAEDAAEFFFPGGSSWTSLVEVRLNDKYGKSAGNIDLVLVSYNEKGDLTGYGALEVQSVYISGNVRDVYEQYMLNPNAYQTDLWDGKLPNPDYLSSSRKRLAPQMIYKGGILKAWGRKMAVALNSGFFATLPELPEVVPEKADIVWLVYELILNEDEQRYILTLSKKLYTAFKPALQKITESEVGDESNFIRTLQKRLNKSRSGDESSTIKSVGLEDYLKGTR